MIPARGVLVFVVALTTALLVVPARKSVGAVVEASPTPTSVSPSNTASAPPPSSPSPSPSPSSEDTQPSRDPSASASPAEDHLEESLVGPELEAPPAAPVWGGPRIPGTFDSSELVAVAARLRGLGVAESLVNRRVFAPFIVAGRAGWSDTWGAPRRGPGEITRSHIGQDVSCDAGEEVLASEAGVVRFGTDPLAGLVARLFTTGGYWYYAHLDSFPPHLASGSSVAPGSVIGYCGTSGNAVAGRPHVHFSRVQGGVVTDPMLDLIDWLRVAEMRAGRFLEKRMAEAARAPDPATLRRRFGDRLLPFEPAAPLPCPHRREGGYELVAWILGEDVLAAEAPPG